MFTIIEATILTALFVNGLQIATSENMIFHFVQVWLDKLFLLRYESVSIDEPPFFKNKPVYSKLYYPILYCVKCMPSIYGTAICLLFMPLSYMLLWQIPLVIFCSSALSAILFQLYE